MTKQRIEIIDILAGESSHPSARSILQKAREKSPQISQSTVYHTLDVLKRAGLILEIELHDKDSRFDGNAETHIHLICTCCGAIADFHEGMADSDLLIEERTGFTIQSRRFEYYGICAACRERKQSAAGQDFDGTASL